MFLRTATFILGLSKPQVLREFKMPAKPTPPSEPTPFQKFKDLTRKLVAVPKAEIVAEEKKWKKKRAKKKQAKK